MIRCLLPICLALASVPYPLRAQQSQEASTDFGTPLLDRRSQAEPNLSRGRQEILEQTNAFRREHGQPPVRLNSDLETAASSFADFMATHDKYGHNADGHQPWERVHLAGYDYCLVDENIAYALSEAGFSTDKLVEIFVHGWEKSPEHRRNMLDPDVIDVGVAISHDPKTGKYYAVQDFGRPKSMAYRFTLSNDTDDGISYRVGDKDFKLPAHYRMIHSRCRLSTVKVTLPGRNGEEEHSETLKPTNGQSFSIQEGANGLAVVSAN